MRSIGYRLCVMAAVLALAGGCSEPGNPQQKDTPAAPAVTSAPTAAKAAAPAASADAGPVTEDGIYTFHNSCPGEGSCYRYWRAEAKIELRADADGAAPVVATLAHGDWVELVDGFVRLVPTRGVVLRDDQDLKKGDVVYIIGFQGEGIVDLWRRGETLSWQDEGAAEKVVEWDKDKPNAARDAKLGWWVKLKTAKGTVGWVRDPSGFECIGQLQGSANCRDDDGKPFKQ